MAAIQAVLRRATLDDEPTLVAIERECFAHPHWTAPDFSRYETTVAQLEGKTIAFAVKHRVFEQTGSDRTSSEFEILNVAVLPAYRRQGIARALLEALMQPCGSYFLEVRESNGSAQELYRRLGFQEVGRRPNYYDLPEETAIVMCVKRC